MRGLRYDVVFEGRRYNDLQSGLLSVIGSFPDLREEARRIGKGQSVAL